MKVGHRQTKYQKPPLFKKYEQGGFYVNPCARDQKKVLIKSKRPGNLSITHNPDAGFHSNDNVVNSVIATRCEATHLAVAQLDHS